jgi:putative phosphoribosyl transferase
MRHASSRKGKMMFRDRKDAGERLAAQLLPFKDKAPVVLALPRGGVAIGFEIARLLGAPLDVVLVRKIGVPWQPELALGALADCGGGTPEIFIDERMQKALDIPPDYVRDETARQLAELERRRQIYCAGRPPVEIGGRTAIVVDDGIATGATMRVALRAVRRRGPAFLVLAAPVAAADTLAALASEADQTVCVAAPKGLGAIGYYYEDFHQMSDDEVTDLLARAPAAGGTT